MPGPETASRPAPRAHTAAPPVPDTASDVVRWAAFSCVLVPVVLVWYGTSLAGAAGTALGLAAVTAACRVLLRQSERGAARLLAEERAPARGRHGASGAQGVPASRRVPGPHEGPHWGSHGVPASREAECAGGPHGRSGVGARRGGRHGGGNRPVD
ncbi:hypothetical protein [Streptomyces sp. NBC_00038]|uniref:hypothetical protein n=1 Tax=Streptomyces sp. NBC_00038 TaxID=2903615 RepID=UPI002252D0BC|nr:hypothetical protein [Streptomyces sp. NBC_00038]MCX5557924.1 hypothetical protein [Streptomyces sp. NBC_00038]